MAKTSGDTQGFDCTIRQYADVDGHHTLDVHLPGLLGVLRLRLGDDLGRLDLNGGYSNGRLGRGWRLVLSKVDRTGDCLAGAAGNAVGNAGHGDHSVALNAGALRASIAEDDFGCRRAGADR